MLISDTSGRRSGCRPAPAEANSRRPGAVRARHRRLSPGRLSNSSRKSKELRNSRELHAIQDRYGDGLDCHSHGESYLELFQARFVPGGLYLLDEPEAALSPLRQLGFLSLLKEMVGRDAQFIIATHSPILMAFPEAKILSFDQSPLQNIDWTSLEHVTFTRDFLNNPKEYLRHI